VCRICKLNHSLLNIVINKFISSFLDDIMTYNLMWVCLLILVCGLEEL
jgi:hypothetical protein